MGGDKCQGVTLAAYAIRVDSRAGFGRSGRNTRLTVRVAIVAVIVVYYLPPLHVLQKPFAVMSTRQLVVSVFADTHRYF